MSVNERKSIMVVGAHAGDAELMAGGVAAKYAHDSWRKRSCDNIS